MKSNSELEQDVHNAICWEPLVHAAEINVTAKDGIVTLSGTVNSYSKRLNAERATKKVFGVSAITQDITVDVSSSLKTNDTVVTNEILGVWKNNWQVPSDNVRVIVQDGWVKLEGDVAYKFQEEAAKTSIENLHGIKGITNLVKIKSQSKDMLEKKSVEDALYRNWSIPAKDIKVDVDHDRVKLTGIVHSLYQKEEAGRLAWNAPGVCSVDNELDVIYN